MQPGIVLLIGLLLCGCDRENVERRTRYSPKPEDEKWAKGTVILELSSVSSNGSVLNLEGMLPTPCHELRISEGRGFDVEGFVLFEVWSVSDPGKTCAQMMQAFSVQLPVKPGLKIKINGQTVKN